eukprot:sb/3478238/
MGSECFVVSVFKAKLGCPYLSVTHFRLLSCYIAIRFTLACLRRQNGRSSLKCNSNLSQVLISSTHDLPVTTELSLRHGLVLSHNFSYIFIIHRSTTTHPPRP